jgi:uncharacterized protein YggE
MKKILLTLAFGLLLFLAARHLGWRISGANVSTVTADGEGRIEVAADQAEATVTANAADKTAAVVNDALAARVTTLLAFLKENGQARAIRTERIDVQPHYDYVKGVQVANGYTGQVAVRFDCDAKAAGTLIAGALSHGADASGGFTTKIAEDALPKAREQAIAAAVADALWKARAGLKAAGVVETHIRNLTVNTGGQGPVARFTGGMALAAAAPIPVEGGQREVTATASVVLEFKRK